MNIGTYTGVPIQARNPGAGFYLEVAIQWHLRSQQKYVIIGKIYETKFHVGTLHMEFGASKIYTDSRTRRR
jgi:hypothetical protein